MPNQTLPKRPLVYDELNNCYLVPIAGKSIYGIIDVEDYGKVSGNNYKLQNGYPSLCVKKNRMHLHQQLIGKQAKGTDIDHINGNKLDNRRSNLRVCTHKQNCYNAKKILSRNGRATGSKYKGVTWDKERNKWTAWLSANGKTKFLGRYSTEEDAARAHDVEAAKHYKEFARLNFVA